MMHGQKNIKLQLEKS